MTDVRDAIPAFIPARSAAIDRALRDALDAVDAPANLRDAMRYAATGGKFLRPILATLCCDLVGGALDAGLVAGVAVEFVHAFSLVHDDLPAMDDDTLRRGRPTLHVQAGEAMAVLAGDALLNAAFETLADAPLPAETVVRLTRELSSATRRMIVGQVYDTLGGRPADFSDRQMLDLIHHHKTGALLRASCRMGAIAGGADEASLAAVDRYGTDVGLMFQIVDDLLDVTQTTEHLGKTAGKDSRAGKLTFAGVLGVEASRREVARLRADAAATLRPLGERAAPLEALASYLADRTR
ncbi:MAG: polyprenyl synthetase family protein [Phycisphaerales bacterium]|nr:polyprenyl synthetase family protein [Phycisphaerales bacterium]